jgi:hypothetical protein
MVLLNDKKEVAYIGQPLFCISVFRFLKIIKKDVCCFEISPNALSAFSQHYNLSCYIYPEKSKCKLHNINYKTKV